MDANASPTVPDAAGALIAELERESARLADLRADATAVESRCGHLMNAADSALSALDRDARRPFLERLRRLQIDQRRLGRPATDGRRDCVLTYLAEKGHGRITNAEVRQQLKARGHDGTSPYVGNLLYKLTQEGMLIRSGYGEYTIAHDHERLRLLRFRVDRESAIAHERARRVAQHRTGEIARAETANAHRPLRDVPGLRARLEREAQTAYEAGQRAVEAGSRGTGEPDWTKQTDENGLYDPGW